MSRRPPTQGEATTFQVSICRNYDASLPKEENRYRVASGWEAKEVSWDEESIVGLVTESGISPNFFASGKRRNANWQGIETVMIDFDDGLMTEHDLLSLQQGWEFDSYVFSSQNHQKVKNDKEACDRLRAFIPLSRRIYDIGELELIKQYFLETIPGIDASCFDPARYFAHGTDEVSSFECGRGFLDVDRLTEYMVSSPPGGHSSYTDPVLNGLKRDELDRLIGIPSPEELTVPETGAYPDCVLEELRKFPGGLLAQTLSGTRSDDKMYKSSHDGSQVHDRSMHDISIAGSCGRVTSLL